MDSGYFKGLNLNPISWPVVVTETCNSGTSEAKLGGLPVSGQPGEYGRTLSHLPTFLCSLSLMMYLAFSYCLNHTCSSYGHIIDCLHLLLLFYVYGFD